MPSAGQKRLSRRWARHARSLKNRVCTLQESPPRPLRLVPSTPVKTLTSHIAVRLGSQRPIYVPGLARAGQEHRSKRCASGACCRGLRGYCERGRVRRRYRAQRAVSHSGTSWFFDIKSVLAMGGPPLAISTLISKNHGVFYIPVSAPRWGPKRHFRRSERSIPS